MAEQWGQADGSLTEQWTRVRARLRVDVGDAAFNSWLKPLTLGDFNRGRLRVAVPTRFMRDWIEQNYAAQLAEFWAEENEGVETVEIIVEPTQTVVQPAGAPPRQPISQRIESEAAPRGANGGTALAGVHDGGEPPLEDVRAFIDEGVGLGKTHLMHAIAWRITERDPKRRVLYMSAEKFMYQFIRALRYRTIMDFKEQFRSVDVLMIDDIQFIAGKDSTQEEFFHTFNALVDQNRQIIVSADKSPSDLEGMEERLKSRLGCGLVADIHPTDYELRLGILQAKAEHIGTEIPDKVMEFLAHKITSNVRELEGALNRIVAHATLVGQDVLHDLLRANDRRVTIEEIQKRVAEHFNIRLADMHSARRARAVARPRQVAMYLAKQLTSRSLPEIGRKFGGRDHTTVMHAVRKVEELRSTDAGFNEDVELLRRMLEI
ncbi:MAG: chromosomal replication initiator protein DnaA [Alphaproteobacteria bacterium]|nr:chromosomal replication initiator protein DnaA [Alphaproteobacteria bacterium]